MRSPIRKLFRPGRGKTAQRVALFLALLAEISLLFGMDSRPQGQQICGNLLLNLHVSNGSLGTRSFVGFIWKNRCDFAFSAYQNSKSSRGVQMSLCRLVNSLCVHTLYSKAESYLVLF